jgi:adenylosuccinate lyase
MELAQVFGQFGNDCRILMMPEIGEVMESAPAGTISSSTMAGKVNPRWSESNVGMAKLAKWAVLLPLDCFQSNLQRDLTDSACYRFFPLTVIFLATQLENLLRENRQTKLPFLKGLTINPEACLRNLQKDANVTMGEALYLALQWHGYSGDAHKLVNDVIVPASRISGLALVDVAQNMALTDPVLQTALSAIPDKMMKTLRNPQDYIGDAPAQALAIAEEAEQYAST